MVSNPAKTRHQCYDFGMIYSVSREKFRNQPDPDTESQQWSYLSMKNSKELQGTYGTGYWTVNPV